MALLSVGNDSEETVHLRIEGEEAASWLEEKPGHPRPCFNKVLLAAVAAGLLCVASVAMPQTVWGIKAKPRGTTGLWNEFHYRSDYWGLDQYRRQVSHEVNSNDDEELVSWDTVMCHAMEDNKKHLVQQLAVSHPGTLHAHCHSYSSPLEFAIHAHADMVEGLLWAGARVDDKMMVEAACHQLHASGSKNEQTDMLLRMLLELGRGNPNAFYNGQSPINCAARACDSAEVQLLMEAGAYINTKDHGGFTPLLNSLAGGCDFLAQEFIQQGADINVKTSQGENALQVACQKCMADAGQSLLEKGIHVDHKDNQGRTALDSAAKYGCVPIASALLDNPFTNVNEVDDSGKTALFIAIEGSGPESLLRMLLEKGADVNHQDQNGATPLIVAAQVGKDCQLLLQHGADAAVVDKAGNTALWHAASAGSARAASSLLEFGHADLVNQKGEKGKTPLAIACWNTHSEVAQVLVVHGADPAIKDDYGQEPLSLATQFTMHLNPGQKPVRTPQSIGTVDQWTGRQEKLLGVLKVLVDAKVNLNIYDFEGFTPLLNLLRFQKNQWGVPSQAEAFSRASQANANFLVWSGANPNMASKQGAITPLAFCAYNGYPSTAALLLQKGANRYARNQWGKTPAELCGVGAGQVEVKQLLR